MKKLRLLFVLLWMTSNLFSSPVTGLLERIDKGASSKFIIERQKSETDFFELDQKGNHENIPRSNATCLGCIDSCDIG